MAEPGLTLTFQDIRAEVAHYLGYGRDDSKWGAAKEAELQSIIDRGYRNFLYPPKVEENKESHRWSFLTPETELEIVNGTDTYDLPDNFSSMDGYFAYKTDVYQRSVEVINKLQLRELQATTVTTGYPTAAIIMPKPFDGTAGQRWQVTFYPEPAYDLTFVYSYLISPAKFTAANPYHIGGALHGETVLNSCLAVAESSKDDLEEMWNGKFMKRLVTSVGIDAEYNASQNMGYNGNPAHNRRGGHNYYGRNDWCGRNLQDIDIGY